MLFSYIPLYVILLTWHQPRLMSVICTVSLCEHCELAKHVLRSLFPELVCSCLENGLQQQ